MSKDKKELEHATRYICVLDFEATCWKENNNHEIIEFPSILWKWQDYGFNKNKNVTNIQKIS